MMISLCLVVSTTSMPRNLPGSNFRLDEENADDAHYGTFQPQGKVKKPCTIPTAQHEPPTRPSGHTYVFVYCSHFLSAWGDRMWSFGVGLFLVRIAGNNLQLPATYGLASGLSIFLLGALVGDWVDSTPRLKAAQLSLVLQNVLVVICAAGVYAYIRFEPSVVAVPGGWSVPLCHAAVILLAVLADLACLARVIAVERDWIVKICDTDTDMLAKMMATLRRIDQTTLIMAPIATGQVMTYAGLENGALFIGVWNLCSVAVEYYLMWKVYTTVPALAHKQTESMTGKKALGETAKTGPTSSNKQTDPETSLSHTVPDSAPGDTPSSLAGLQPHVDDDSVGVKTMPQCVEPSWSHGSDMVSNIGADTEILLDDSDEDVDSAARGTSCCCQEGGCAWRVLHQFITLYRGWRTYVRYSVALAGLALACLYMTVLGFDNITVAYAVTQGVSESILGILMGASAIFGMLGTFIYPVLRRRVGLVRTGLLALSAQVVCLSLCVVSVWMPGSPFDPTFSSMSGALVHNATQVPTSQTGDADWLTLGTPSAQTQPKEFSEFSPAVIVLTSNPAVASTQTTPLVNLRMSVSSSSTHTSLNTSCTSEAAAASLTSILNLASSSSTAFSPILDDALAEMVTSTSVNLAAIFSTTAVTSLAPASPGSESPSGGDGDVNSYASVFFLMAGIVLARFGLWTADLAITQLFLEAVVEKERGVVNGVQSSLNKLMDVLKFALVVAIPDTETFGFLIITSFSFICLGWLLYAVFLRKDRGHIFHCPRCGSDASYASL